MIIIKISGSLAQQLSQYTFGRESARLLGTELKLDITDFENNPEHKYSLDLFTITEFQANKDEIEAAKKMGVLVENTPLWTSEIVNRIHDGLYLDGVWADYRYAEADIHSIGLSLQPRFKLAAEFSDVLEHINACDAVAVDLRCPDSNELALPACYFEDAVKEFKGRNSNAHFFVFVNHEEPHFIPSEEQTIIAVNSTYSEAHYLELMKCCKHYIVTYQSLSYWSARLGKQNDIVVIAPQQAFRPDESSLIARYGSVQQPVWPKAWQVLPVRIEHILPAPATFKGGRSETSPIRVGVWNYYEEITRNGFLFKNTEASIGANLLKPWCDLYEYGQAHGIHFVTLDQINGINDLDAVIFLDRPRSGHPLIDALMQSGIKKYLLLYENEIIKPDNWDVEFHQQFDRIFTWNDELADGRRYIKFNYATDPNCPYDFDVLKTAFEQRKLVTLIAGAKASHHPKELYSHRLRAIRWFEASAQDDFDLYGQGWNREHFTSYKGAVQNKLATLSHYRFAICYENAKDIPGYITEKLLDCLRAGTVPVYGGAPNTARWIPNDCYINIGQFETYGQLYEHLKSMDAITYNNYLDRIRHYLYSEQSYPFTTECFITTLTEVVAWDIQVDRHETPLFLLACRATGSALEKTELVQNLETMQIELEVSQTVPIMERITLSPEEAKRASLQNAGRKDLIVYLGYGDELPVYQRARAIWEFYISHFPNIKAYFVRDTKNLPRGEIVGNGYDLLVGIGESGHNVGDSGPGYKESGTWSVSENAGVIYKQMAVFDYMLRMNPNPFYLFHATVTSVVDFRGLVKVMDRLPATQCFAGMAGQLTKMNVPEVAGLTFICGTNSIFSRDMMELLRSRYDPNHPNARFPNDVWQSLTLKDIPRIPILPFFSFLEPRKFGSSLDDVGALTRQLLNDGHFHFRVKTSNPVPGMSAREDIDPWIMLKIMQTILDSHPPEQASRILSEKLSLMVNSANGQTLAAFAEEGFFSGPRDFPLNDIEAKSVYPNLQL
jgi:hypothetical protein